jgi:tRNA dimethylallyltransferase
VDLATRFNGEIINGDAMQMYNGLPIVTNKITVEEQQGIPHHLLGFIPLDEEPWRVDMFKRKASQIIQEIRSRGRLPIVVGGTHYYTQSLLFGDTLLGEYIDGEDTQTELSTEIHARFPILEGPTDGMIEQLREVDPVMADRWHPKDRRKIQRSLEIYLLTGKKASDIYAEQKEARSLNKEANLSPISPLKSDSTLLFWVHSQSEILKKRLDARVHKMMEAGLLDEVKAMENFLANQLRTGKTVDRSRGVWVSIGWKEFEKYLLALKAESAIREDLERLYNESVEQTQSATRQYAKRQVRWIRLKLMPALSDGSALDKLFLLDGSDVTQWAETVSNPARNITEKFLAGEELPLPHETSAAANEFLAPKKATELIRRECEMCNTVVVTEDQWEAHLKSRRHRALVKKSLKLENRSSER